MRNVADALFASEETRARTAKVEALAHALAGVYAREPARLPFAARFMTGSMLATDDERTLGAGGALVFEAAASVTGMPAAELGSRARAAGDLGTAIGDAVAVALVSGRPEPPGLRLEDAEAVAHAL